MTPEAMTIVGIMAGAIGALSGYIIWLFKLILTRQDTRITTLENRESTFLATIAKNAETAAVGIHALAEAIKELRLLFLNLRSDADRR